jgi:hypothetical protein
MRGTRLMRIPLLLIATGLCFSAQGQEMKFPVEKVHNESSSVSVNDCTELGTNTTGCFDATAGTYYRTSDNLRLTDVRVYQSFTNKVEQTTGWRSLRCIIPGLGDITVRELSAKVDVRLSARHCQSEGMISNRRTDQTTEWGVVDGERLVIELAKPLNRYSDADNITRTDRFAKQSVRSRCRQETAANTIGFVEFGDVAFAVNRGTYDSRFGTNSCTDASK